MEFINEINAILTDNFGEMGPLYAAGLLGVLLILLSLPTLLKKQVDPLDKLKRDIRADAARNVADPGKSLRPRSRTEKLDRFSTFLEPQDEEELSAAKLKLLQAGYRSKASVRMFHFAQLALGLGFLGLGMLFAVIKSATGDVTTQMIVLSVVIPGAAGYYLPKYWVERRLQSRQQEIIEGFPDSLDMMLVCVEAGQSLDQSIIRVSKEIRAGYPALADEYELVAHEMKAGKEKVQVLKDMSERCGVADVSSFVTVLIQSTTFGTSIAEALRVYAGEMRDKRVMRAEEKANTLPTKLTLGTMMFTVPPLMIILIGPSIYDIYTTLSTSNF
ncbi:tight adherence protein C [Rhodovulum iodosum]|uniref:Tight adherence protein C n=1 Tax=Rhodovulum iodosum TaxID=68291 RepID=A0ABV3XX72_9RHOB|nr:type II secretion system F family protein [Rhodovulum robiginosum]RSK36768.1 type II secretion system F family protein [Rhodovulum robiginosum]